MRRLNCGGVKEKRKVMDGPGVEAVAGGGPVGGDGAGAGAAGGGGVGLARQKMSKKAAKRAARRAEREAEEGYAGDGVWERDGFEAGPGLPPPNPPLEG